MDATPLARDGDGTTGFWSADVKGVEAGAEYKFTIRTPDGDLSRIDPYARQMTSSGRATASSTTPTPFDSGDHDFPYAVVGRRRHLRAPRGHLLRRRARSAGTSTSRPIAGSSTCATSGSPSSRSCRRSSTPATSPGATTRATCSPWSPATAGPTAFKQFIKGGALEQGMAVIVDVVHNHIGPSDLDLWRFDGWSEGDGGGIYFYNDERARDAVGRHSSRLRTARGAALPARQRHALARGVPLRRAAVRRDELHPVGPRAARGHGGAAIPATARRIPRLADRARSGASQPWSFLIAEDLQLRPRGPSPPPDDGGLGFHAQWDAGLRAPACARHSPS